MPPTANEPPEPAQRLMRAAYASSEGRPLDSLEMIERELRELLDARQRFTEWVEQVRRDQAAPGQLNPAQYLHAWNDSTTRVIQLLRAHRDLGGAPDGDLADLLRRAYERLEESSG